ncbi:RMD1 family protein [Aliiglaciecola sp. LCG003]|uniref:RMD1 family protein n=1 Tax=Aliiglaciecola sp. LCG003 TaxID=3053655 RepID=UPI00257348C2|nr:RMD1 family protein [Aliiglaciecola sp. LCG003]WJG07753.1 RMD1 family protein [Aliiglaciecola sp. LCG003]
MTSNFSSPTVDVVCIADTIDIKYLENHFAKTFVSTRYRDALHIDLPKGQVVIFDYGVIVTWGISDSKKQFIMDEMASVVKLKTNLDWDMYGFEVKTDEAFSISNDKLILPSSKTLTLLAISHAFAQSHKLEIFEARAQKTIDDNSHLTDELAKTGKIPLTRKQLAKLRGALFQTKSDITLHFSLLDTPEFFWDYPATQEFYSTTVNYMELAQRIELLNLKLQTIHELFDMFAAEQNHKHSSFLEWIIIILIAVEIVLFFVH